MLMNCISLYPVVLHFIKTGIENLSVIDFFKKRSRRLLLL